MRDAREVWAQQWRETGVTVQERDVYYYMDTIKLQHALRLLRPGSRCLEVGSGSARLSVLLAAQGHHLTCLDYTSEGLNAARRNFATQSLDGFMVQGNAVALPFQTGSFDAVFSTGLLEHFDDPFPVVSEMARVLRQGGIFFSDIVPRKFSLLRAFDFVRGAPAVFERSFTRNQILEMLERANLVRTGAFAGAVYPPLYVPVLIRSSLYRRMHASLVRALLPVTRRLEGTRLARLLGFYWFCWGYKVDS
jgi:ubiquinone/menaquinone biosynthesis C-methylase UbiE